MRRHHRNFLSQSNDFVLYTIKRNVNRETITTTQEIPSGSTRSFTHTDFTNCECTGSNSGGAISCTSGSLTIEDCTFKNCKSSDRSGAVFFSSPNLCNDTNNFFANCSSVSHTGTIEDFRATHSVHSLSTYINSHAGGVFGMLNVETTSDASVSSCILINGSTNVYCGLFTLTKISGLAIISNCVFAKGSAKSYGGGFGTHENYTGNPRPYFYFSFFCNNVCSDANRGADFDANGTTGQYYTKDKIIHCFSSSRGRRVYIEGKSADVDNWLIKETQSFSSVQNRNKRNFIQMMNRCILIRTLWCILRIPVTFVITSPL